MSDAGLEDRIRALPFWVGAIEIEKLTGGITNHSFVVKDARRKVVVRTGGDIPVHGVMRFNDHAASYAAAAVGVSPKVLYSTPDMLVIEYIEGETLTEATVRANRDRCVALIGRVHREVVVELRGPILAFNVFHNFRHYRRELVEAGSSHAPKLDAIMAKAERLETIAGHSHLVFSHNDFVPNNLLDDGKRLWAIDWDYAGFNTALFDLAGLSSNSRFTPEEDEAVLTAYFSGSVSEELHRRYKAMQAASLLREAMWSMVQELHSTLDFNYAARTAEQLVLFDKAYEMLEG